MTETYLSLGSNLGYKEENLDRAIDAIKERVGIITKNSGYYYTEPWKMHSKNEFINAVIVAETELTPLSLLFTLQDIEREMGRTRKSVQGIYEDRIIDIDILTYGKQHIETYELTIPHPLMWQRPFVMRGLALIDPRFVEEDFQETFCKETPNDSINQPK